MRRAGIEAAAAVGEWRVVQVRGLRQRRPASRPRARISSVAAESPAYGDCGEGWRVICVRPGSLASAAAASGSI